jgi:integrase
VPRIRERAPGVWEVTAATGRDPRTGRYGQISRTVRGTKRAANQAAAELLTEVANRSAGSPEGSVGHLLDAFLDHANTRGLAPKTLLGYELLAKQAKADFGSVDLRKLTAARLDSYYRGLIRRGLSARTVGHHHAFLRSALRQGVRWRWIARSPADTASPPRAPSAEPEVPSIAQVRRLLTEAETYNPDLTSMLWVAATTGMRRGELCGLRWPDIDFASGTLTVRTSISDLPGRVEVRPTRSRRVRRIAIDPGTVAVLDRQRHAANDRCRAFGAHLDDDAYVWSQDPDHGSPWRPDRVTHAFERVRERAGLSDIRFHHLRHFAATMMLSGDVDVRTAAGRLGHADSSVTLRTYAHVLEQRDREAAAVLGALFEERTLAVSSIPD